MNLNGNYATTVGAQYVLTTGVLNLTGRSNCVLQFQRWLNSDYSLFVQAEIYLSKNGTAWTRVWANGLAAMDDAWTKQHVNISALADNQPSIQLRWTYRIIKTGARPMSGWNIDDVEILADAAPVVIPPRLDIQSLPPDSVQLSWPTNSAGFVLQQNFDLGTTNWLDASNLISIVGTNHQTTIPHLSGTAYFRLRSP